MEIPEKTIISISVDVKANPETVWKAWTHPEHIVKWNHASDDWHSPSAQNDLKAGGRFVYRMEAKDGSAGFDFSGVYVKVKCLELIEYIMDDGRKAEVSFSAGKNYVNVKENFEAEAMNSPELQKKGWQSILNNFRKYAEELSVKTGN